MCSSDLLSVEGEARGGFLGPPETLPVGSSPGRCFSPLRLPTPSPEGPLDLRNFQLEPSSDLNSFWEAKQAISSHFLPSDQFCHLHVVELGLIFCVS